jgi:plasmid stabilization system protein ParE
VGDRQAPAETARRRLNCIGIVWTEAAVDHLDAIVTYVSVYDPAAAERLAQSLIKVADSLAEFPHRGRDVGDGKREITSVWPYIVRYRVQGDTVFILRIRHGARQEDGS